jgi:hypothetical protein
MHDGIGMGHRSGLLLNKCDANLHDWGAGIQWNTGKMRGCKKTSRNPLQIITDCDSLIADCDSGSSRKAKPSQETNQRRQNDCLLLAVSGSDEAGRKDPLPARG